MTAGSWNRVRIAVVGAAALSVAAVVAGTSVQAGQAQSARTIWDGVFTAAQAQRGQATFRNSCGRCHNDELVGSERGPALSGDAFWQRWDNDSFDRLFTKVRDTMPQGGIESVTDESKADALAFILSKNGARAGAKELPVDLPELEAITIVRQGGVTGGVANFNLVQVVGCLAGRQGGDWTLTRATAPAVTKDESADQAALARAATAPLGTEVFQLLSVVPAMQAAGQAGHKVEARGLLYRSGGESLMNVTALKDLGTPCS